MLRLALCPRSAACRVENSRSVQLGFGLGGGSMCDFGRNHVLQVYKPGELGRMRAGESVDTDLSGRACGMITVMYYL